MFPTKAGPSPKELDDELVDDELLLDSSCDCDDVLLDDDGDDVLELLKLLTLLLEDELTLDRLDELLEDEADDGDDVDEEDADDVLLDEDDELTELTLLVLDDRDDVLLLEDDEDELLELGELLLLLDLLDVELLDSSATD